jgi:hypothetical protein
MNPNDLQLNIADTLGLLLAEIATLTKRADTIKDIIKDDATSSNKASHVVEGNMFKATVVEANRNTVDYKKLCADRGITANELAAYTKVCAVFSVKVTAR